jgi:autotransporter-associated beta strand protein
MSMKKKSGSKLAIAMMLCVVTGAQAASDAWNMDASGNWDAGGNWLGSAVPGSTTADNTDVATFSYTLTADCIITVDAPRYIGGLSFGNTSAFKYTLSSGALQLNNGGVIQTLAGNGDHTDTIDTPIQLNGSTAFFTANAASASSLLSIGAVTGSATAGNTTTLTLDGSNPGANAVTGVISDGSGGGALALRKEGVGLWRLSGENTYTGLLDNYGDQSAATGGWSIGPEAANEVTNTFKSGSTIVVDEGKMLLVGGTGGLYGPAYSTLHAYGAVNNSGTLQVERAGTLNLYSGAVWQQNGEMWTKPLGGRHTVINLNSGAIFTYAGPETIKINPANDNTGNSTLTIMGTFTTAKGFEQTETLTRGTAWIRLGQGGQLLLTGPITDLTLFPENKPMRFSLESGGGLIDVHTNHVLLSSLISGSGTLTKRGTGMLTLTNANTYTGGTTNESGILRLVGGDNRIKAGNAFVFASSSTLDVDSTSQTFSSLGTPSTGAVITVKGSAGSLVISGSSGLEFGPNGAVTNTYKTVVNMSELRNFTYDSASATNRVGPRSSTNNGPLDEITRVTLAKTNLIRAGWLFVGERGCSNDGGLSILTLGQENTFKVNIINSGYSGRSDTHMAFAAGLTAPTVTIRNTDGTSPVTSWSIGNVATFSTAGQKDFTDIVDFSAGTVDALLATLNIGTADTGSQTGRAGTENASFSMGLGALTVSTLNLGRMLNGTGGTVGGIYRANGTFTLDGGTVNATTINMTVNTINDTSSNSKIVSGTFNLSNGTLRAAAVQLGPQTGTATASTTFRWVKGTVGNFSGSDLIWTNIPLTLQTAASHVFDITGGNIATFDANSPISGSGCPVTKTGSGTLKLCGANTYSGGTTVSNGTLVAGGNNALAAGSDLILSGGAFDAGSFANTLDMLTVSDSTTSQLLVSDPGCLLSFTGMDGTGTLTVTGTLGSTSVRFGTSGSALTGEQLSRISVNGFPAGLSVSGYLREVRGTLIQFR